MPDIFNSNNIFSNIDNEKVKKANESRVNFWNEENKKYAENEAEYKDLLERYQVPISQDDYNVIKNVIADAENPVDETYRWASAIQINQQYGLPLQSAYENLEQICAAKWGEEYTFTPKTAFKAIVDSGRQGVNTLKMGKIGSQIMIAESNLSDKAKGAFYADDLEKLYADYEALEKENEGLEDLQDRNAFVEMLKFGGQSLPFTGYVAGASALGSLIAPGVGTAAGFAAGMQNASGLQYIKLRRAGSSAQAATALALLEGSLESLVENALGNVPAALGKKTLGEAAFNATKQRITGNIFKRFAYDGTAKKLALRLTTEYLKEAPEEGIEEVVQDFISKGVNALAAELGGYDIEPMTAHDIARDAFENFRGGFMGSLALGIGTSALKTKADIKEYFNVRRAAEVIQSKEAFKNVTKDNPIFRDLSDEERSKVQDETWERVQARMDAEANEEAKKIAEVQDAADVDEELKMGDEGEEAEPTPVTRDDETGKLYTQNVLDHDEEGNTTGGTFLAGDNKNTVEVNGEKKAARYGYINWEFADGDQNKIIINDFKMKKGREGIRSELFNEFAMQHPGVDIQWNTKKGIAQDIKNILIKNNPSGKKNGLNYYADQNAIADASTRAWVDKQVSENIFDRESYVDEEGNTRYRKVQLSKEKRAAAVALLEAAAKRQHMSLTDYVNKTFGTQIFGDRRVLQRAAFAQAQQDIKNGKIPKAKAGGVDVGTAQAEWKKFGQEVKAVIYAGENADFSTWAHELAHIFQNQLEGDLKKQAEDAFGVKDGDWEHTMYTFADGKKMPAAEAFAYGFQDWLKTGKAENEQMKNIFKEFAKFIAQAYNSLKKFINLTPEITSVYEQLLSGEDSLLKAAEMAVEAEDRRYRAQMQQQAQEAENQKKAEAEQQKKAEEAERDENSETTDFEEEEKELTPEEAEKNLQEATNETEKENNAIDDALENTNLTDDQKTEIADVLKDETTTVEEKAEAATDAASSVYEDEQIEIDPNLMFQLAGEPSIRRMAEVEERERILADLEAAQLLDDRYKSMDAKSKASRIRMMTGWEKDATGAWKFELDDSINRIKTEVFKNNPELLTDSSASTLLNLGDILDAPELYKVFPYMQNVRVSFYSDPNAFRAVLTPQGIKVNTRYLKGMNGETGLKGVLAHEIQHIIQAMEFAESKGIQGENIEQLYNDMMAAMQAAGERKYDYDITSLQNGLDAYMKDAGEIEARNVARRILMNADQRRMNTLASTEDVKRNIQFQDEAERQMEAVRKQYENTDQWMKAPNGQPTKLSEKQWLQVRTPAFKKFFGDWEKSYKATKILNEESIDLTKNELSTLRGIDQRKKAESIYKKLLNENNEKITTVDGRVVSFTKTGFKELKSHSANPTTLQIVPQLEEIIKTATPFFSEDNKETSRPNIKAFHSYARKIALPDGDYIARIVLREDNDGTIFYDGEATEIEKIEALMNQPGRKPNAGEDLKVPYKNKILQFFYEVNKNVSKVLDENGEPLVVYHGSSQWFQVFNEGKTNKSSNVNTPDNTIFTNDNKEIASSFENYYGGPVKDVILDKDSPLHRKYDWGTYRAGGVYSLFMNLRNPKVLDYKGQTWKADGMNINDEVAKAMQEGYDGVIAKNIIDVGFTDVTPPASNDYIAFNNTAVKSATDNNGNFDASNPNILFQDEYDPRSLVPNVRGGWTEKKIIKYLKDNPTLSGVVNAIRFIKEFDTPEELKAHMFYHGTALGSDKLKPSITMSDRDIERYGGGGYGQKYWSISVSKSKKVASNFAPMSDGVRIYPIILAKNAKVIEMPELTDSVELEDHIINLWNQGVDAVWIGDKDSGEQELSILNPRAVVNIGRADLYKNYALGTEKNPINIKDDEQIKEMFDYAKNYERKTEEDFGKPRKPWNRPLRPSHFIHNDEKGDFERDSEGNLLRNPNYDTEYEEYEKQLQDFNKQMEEYEQAEKDWYNSDGYKEWEKFDRERRNVIFFQEAYHGSGADFDKFDTEHYGLSGEGSMSFGYGTYVTDNEEIARDYAERQRPDGVNAWNYKGKLINSYPNSFDLKEVVAFLSRGEWTKEGAIKEITDLKESYEKSGSKEIATIGRIEDLNRLLNILNDKDFNVEDFELNGKTHLYTVEIPDDGYLDWQAPITEEFYDSIIKALKKQHKNIKLLLTIPKENLIYKEERDNGTFYRMLSNTVFNSNARETSRFLNSIGYAGIKYPAGTIHGNGKGAYNYVIFNDDDVRIVNHLFYQTEAELQDEALSFDNWQDFMEYCEAMHADDAVSPIPYNADAQWYQSFYETAHGVQTEQEKNEKAVTEKVTKEGMLPGAADALFSTYIKQNPEMLDNFLKAVADLDAIDFNSDEWAQVADEEDAKAREHMDQLKDYIDITLSDYNWQTAIKRIQGGHEISEGLRKRLIGEITDNFKVRDFRALYSEVMEDEQYAVDEEDTTTAQLNKKLKKYKKYDILKPNEDIARVSPERRKRIAEALQNKEIAEKIRNGSLKLDDEIEAYLKSLDKQVKDLQKDYNELEKETQNDYQRLADAERRKLLKLHEELLLARGRMKTRDAETDRKINKGLKITEKYQRQSQNLKADYDELFRKFTDLKNTMQITAEVQAALDRQERVAGIKEDLNSKQKEKSLVAEVKKMRIQLVKRAMRRVPFNRIDYENARTVIAIQRMLEPNLLGGVNRFIGIDSAYLRGVVSGIVTDSDYKDKILSYLRKQDKSSQAFADFLKKVEELKTIKDFDSWTAKERKYAIKHLPKENWVRDLNLLKLAEEREQSIDLDIGMKEKQVMRIDPKTGRAMQDKEGNPIYETTFVLDAADDLKKLVRDAVGADMYDLIVDKPFAEWTTEELERLAQRIDQLYTEGRDMFAAKQEARKREADSIRKRVEDAIKETGITINDDDTPEERKRKEEKIAKILNQKAGLKGTEAGKNSGIKAKFDRLIHGYWDANVLRVARILDNQSEGENVRLLYRREDECFNNKTRSIMARGATVKKVMADNNITEAGLAETIEVSRLGTEFTVDELLYFLAADKDYELDDKGKNDDWAATSRNAVMFGNMMSDNKSQDLKEEWAGLDSAMKEAIENDLLTTEQKQLQATGELDTKPGTTLFRRECHERWDAVLSAANAFLNAHPEYKALMEAIEADYASQYERMNEISINEFNTPVHRVRAYVPLVRRESNGADNVQQVKEDLLAAYGGEAGKQWVNKGMTQRRQNISPLNQKPVQTGLFRTWGDSIERTEHFIAYAPYVRQLNVVYKSRDAAYTRRFIEARYGKPMLEYIDNYINEVANPNAGKIREKGAELLHVLRGKTAPAYLGWKFSAIVKQGLTSPWPYMQFVNPAEYFSAATKCWTSGGKMYDAIKEKSAFMASRVMDPINELVDEMAENAKTKVDRAWSKFSKMGMAGLEWIDWTCVAPGWLACYEKEYNRLQNMSEARYQEKVAELTEKNMTAEIGTSEWMSREQIEQAAKQELMDDIETEAVRYADDCTRACQPSSRVTDLSPLFKNSSEAMKAFLQFQTSLNVIWQNIRYDIPYNIRQKEFKKIVGTVCGYILAGIFMNSVMDGVRGDDDDDDMQALRNLIYYSTTQFTDAIPMFGSDITNMMDQVITGKRGFASSGTDMTPSATKLMSALQKTTKGDYKKAAALTAEGIGLYLGAPVSGVKEIDKLLGKPLKEGDVNFKRGISDVYGIAGDIIEE